MAKVLIVDDSEYTGEAIKILLEFSKIKVVYEPESIKVLEHLKKENFDLIILDLMMPRVSGFELYEAISNDHETKHIPILILTARMDRVSSDQEFKSRLRPTDMLMRKPYDNKELLKNVKDMIQKKHS